MSAIEASGPSLSVLPLGGCGEVGLNATLLVAGDDALLVDCGVMLGLPNAPGVERAVPDLAALTRHGRRLLGVVLTHGHEDHIGALPSLLDEHRVPVYGTPLAVALARSRVESSPLGGRPPEELFHRLPLGGRFKLGPFDVELVRVTHSLPDSAALLIETPAGRVLHSGDFKLDRGPHDGRFTDVERLSAAGDRGVDLLLSDSTNGEVPGWNRAERDVGLEIERLIGEARGRVIVACLASHLHRLEAIAGAARRHGRRIALVGRSLHEMWRIGIETGHLAADPTLVATEERISAIPPRELVVITTGSQGEAQAGLARLASGRDPHLSCGPGDRVILSARTIPGNERAVRRVVNDLVRARVEVFTDPMYPVHCSGHACQAEQAELIRLVRPRHFVPIHGERTMLEAHARTALAAGLPPERVTVVEDGESVVLEGGRVGRGPDEQVSRRALDGDGRCLAWSDVKDRVRISRGGLVVCSAVIDARTGRLAGRPRLSTRGLTLHPGLEARLLDAVSAALDHPSGLDVSSCETSARSAIRNGLRAEQRGSAEVEVHVLARDATDRD